MSIQYVRCFKDARLYKFMTLFLLVIMISLAAMYDIESKGHHITGMSNAVPWGASLALATFYIVAASGALNIASIASVFGKTDYKPASRISCVLAIGLLAGGLFTLLIDLGRPEQIFTALTHFNFSSVFSVNIVVYTVFFVIVGMYGLSMLITPQGGVVRCFGVASFLWRLIMTTGTGSVFGVLAGRTGMNSALMPPLFIALSLSVGLGIFVLAVCFLEYSGRQTGGLDTLKNRLASLLPTLLAVTFYMVLALQLIGLLTPATHDYTIFVLMGGNAYTWLFWMGFLAIGTVLPLVLMLCPQLRQLKPALPLASLATAIGGIALITVLVIAPQAYPADIFPGMTITGDPLYSRVAEYFPTIEEVAMGLAGIGVAGLLISVAARIIPIYPANYSNE